MKFAKYKNFKQKSDVSSLQNGKIMLHHIPQYCHNCRECGNIWICRCFNNYISKSTESLCLLHNICHVSSLCITKKHYACTNVFTLEARASFLALIQKLHVVYQMVEIQSGWKCAIVVGSKNKVLYYISFFPTCFNTVISLAYLRKISPHKMTSIFVMMI